MHLARGAATAAVLFPLIEPARRSLVVRRWSCELLAILGVRLQVSGARPAGAGTPRMLVANHVSWLDILAISAVLPARFVAKSEVRDWPLLGWMGERAGTFFIRRARRRDTARISEDLAQAMRDGDPVAVFPEATTSDGGRVLKFHSSLLQAAVLEEAALHPVAIRYARRDGTGCEEAAYEGGRSLWRSLALVTAQPGIRAELEFLPPLQCRGRHRRELAQAARELITRSLRLPAPGTPVETAGGPRASAR